MCMIRVSVHKRSIMLVECITTAPAQAGESSCQKQNALQALSGTVGRITSYICATSSQVVGPHFIRNWCKGAYISNCSTVNAHIVSVDCFLSSSGGNAFLFGTLSIITKNLLRRRKMEVNKQEQDNWAGTSKASMFSAT